MSFYRETTRTAVKAHRCYGCLCAIEVGSRYLNCAGMSADGDFWSGAYHPDCREWELHIYHESGAYADEFMLLHEQVSGGGREVLDGAPDAVRARFGIGAPA